jgi:hypothetical protein
MTFQVSTYMYFDKHIDANLGEDSKIHVNLSNKIKINSDENRNAYMV